MDYGHIYDLYEKGLFVDLRLTLEDDQRQHTMDLHKTILILHSPFFAKLLTFGKKNIKGELHLVPSIMTIRVPDANATYDLILSFYGQTTNIGSYGKFLHELSLAKCRDYLGLNHKSIEIPEIITSESDYDHFLDLCEIVGFDHFQY